MHCAPTTVLVVAGKLGWSRQHFDLPHRDPQLLDREAAARGDDLHFERSAFAQPAIAGGHLDQGWERAVGELGDFVKYAHVMEL